MNFDQLMRDGWGQGRALLSIEDQLREKLMLAETRIFQLEQEVQMLRGKFSSGPSHDVVTQNVRRKMTVEVPSCLTGIHVSSWTNRQYVYFAFAGQCFYCNCHLQEHSVTVDHQIPKSKGGSRGRSNLVAACGKCNTTKGDRMPTPNELERAHAARKCFDERPVNAIPIRDPWIAEQEAKIEQAMKPNAIYTVRNNGA